MCLTKVDGKHTLREIRLMRWLGRHPNIARLLDVHVSVEDDTVDIIMELMDTDMHRVIRSQSLTEEVSALARQCVLFLLVNDPCAAH